MIEVVIVDDLVEFQNIIKETIILEFKRKNIDIKLYCFEKFDKTFWEIVKRNDRYKLFILDIEVPGMNGIDAARKIRDFDLKSDILFITDFDTIKNKNSILFSMIKPLSFLNKNNIRKDLSEKVDYISNFLKKMNNDQKYIKFKFKLKIYQILESEIDFLEVNKINHKIIVHQSDLKIIQTDTTIKKKEKSLNQNIFFKTHRSCIVNRKNISNIDYKNNTITFFSSNTTQLLARNRKQELKKIIK